MHLVFPVHGKAFSKPNMAVMMENQVRKSWQHEVDTGILGGLTGLGALYGRLSLGILGCC